MHDDSGQLSIDFLVGFTVFLLAFIFVATLSSGLFINLQSKTIDYDAVAYRTGVILAEDPGYVTFDPNLRQPTTKWELLNPEHQEETTRFGLAISPEYPNIYPNILSEGKVQSFFTNEYGFSKEDYASRLIFGDYPYRFNIKIKSLDVDQKYQYSLADVSVADDDTNVQKYGYIRRVVAIKDPGYATFSLPGPADAASRVVNISIDFEDLSNTDRGKEYRLTPSDETIVIKIDNLTPMQTLTAMQFNGEVPPGTSPTVKTIRTNNNLTLFIDPRYTRQLMGDDDKAGKISINLTFDQPVVSTSQFTYTYDNPSVTLPSLVPAVMEVKIW